MAISFGKRAWEPTNFRPVTHRGTIHPAVARHLPTRAIENKVVLVPLCGNMDELLHLAQFAKKVIGIEVCEETIHAFFYQHGFQVSRPNNRTYVAGNITLFCASMHDLQTADIGPVDWILDNGALCVLPHSMRLSYLKAIDDLSRPGTQQLIITLEYFPLLRSTPYSITPAEVEWYYGRGHIIDHVESKPIHNHILVRRNKLAYLIEHAFLLKKFAQNQMMVQEQLVNSGQ